MSAKFTTLLHRYLPSHYKLAPKGVSLYLDEYLDAGELNITRYLVGSLTPDSQEIYYNTDDDLDPFKDEGVVKIEDEYIKYNSINRTTHKLYDLERGFFDTEAVAHCNEVQWSAELQKDIDPYTTTIEFTAVSNIDAIPKEGRFTIFSDTADEETISYTNFSPYLSGYKFENVTRGVYPTVAVNHPTGSYIQESANLLIEQVDTIKYTKGLWTSSLSAALDADDTSCMIDVEFDADVSSTVSLSDTIIHIKNISGTVPANGYVLIGSEIIRYGYFDVDDLDYTAGMLTQCIRANFDTRAAAHAVDDRIYFAVPTYGEFLVEDEYIHYTSYAVTETAGVITGTISGMTRGFYSSIAEEHDSGTTITERRHTEVDASGVFTIGNEYVKYWYVDDDYFYIDKRPALNAKTYYATSGGNYSSIIEPHEQGALIQTYFLDDPNTYLIDFLHTAAENLDLAAAAKINIFEDFSDVDNVEWQYLTYIVKMLGENLDDYQELPFFVGTNSEYRVRLFTKELSNIYKQKGLLSALKLWHTVISEPLTNYQDLWTLNYCSFYSLPFLSLLLYEPSRLFYPNNENFLRPQISIKLQEEIAEYYTGKTLRDPVAGTDYDISNLKLVVKEWEYLCKTDDDLDSSSGKSFDDKILSCDSENDDGIYYDRNNAELQVRDDPTTYIPFPFFVEDYDVDLFKFEDDFELPENKDNMPTFSEACTPMTMDMGFVSDYESDWIQDDQTMAAYDYCNLADKDYPIRTDLDVLVDLTSDIGNAKIELDNNTSATETEIVVRVTEGKLYDPNTHILAGTDPAIPPKGFVKFGDEIISYTGLQYCDTHDGTFANPNRYLLTGCTRGARNTTAESYKVNLYENNERLLGGKTITLVDTSSDEHTYRITLHRDPLGFNVAAGDVIHLVQTDGTMGTHTISAVISSYNYCEETYTYAVEFQTTDTIDTDYPTYASTTQNTCTIDKDTSTIECAAHGLTDGDFVYFLESSGSLHAYQMYYVLNSTADDFQIAAEWDSTLEALSLLDVYNLSNTFLSWSTKILTVEEGYQHRYSMCQHIMWRLENQINGNDLELVYEKTAAQLATLKLDSYKGLGDGVIWPTPHFKYGFDITNENLDVFPPDDVVNLILKKIKQYKPKHTVIDFTIGYPLDTETGQVGVTATTDTYETEPMQSDLYVIQTGSVASTAPTRISISNHDLKSGDIVYIEGTGFTSGSPYTVVYADADTFSLVEATAPALGAAVTVTEASPDEYHIEMRHQVGSVLPDKEWDLTVIKTDVPVDYGATAAFSYVWHDGETDQQTITYDNFEAYPLGTTTDVLYRNRKRHLNYIDL